MHRRGARGRAAGDRAPKRGDEDICADVHAAAQADGTAQQPPEITAETIVGGIYEVVYSRVVQGQTSQLMGLLPDLGYSLMLPYIGHDAAQKEAAKPATPRATEPVAIVSSPSVLDEQAAAALDDLT